MLEGTGRIHVEDESLTLPPLSALVVEPDTVRQVFHYRIGTASSGPSHAPVRIDVSGRGHERARLGWLPVIAARAGMDLHPIDAADPVERRWLRAWSGPRTSGKPPRGPPPSSS